MTYPRLGSPSFRSPRSFADWQAFLAEHRAPPSPAEKPEFGGPFGYSMRKRWDWLQDALERGVDYRAAEAAFDAVVDRERANNGAMGGEPNARSARRAGRSEDSAESIAARARALGLIPPASAGAETFADLRVL